MTFQQGSVEITLFPSFHISFFHSYIFFLYDYFRSRLFSWFQNDNIYILSIMVVSAKSSFMDSIIELFHSTFISIELLSLLSLFEYFFVFFFTYKWKWRENFSHCQLSNIITFCSFWSFQFFFFFFFDILDGNV